MIHRQGRLSPRCPLENHGQLLHQSLCRYFEFFIPCLPCVLCEELLHTYSVVRVSYYCPSPALGTGRRAGYGVGNDYIPLVSVITRPTLRVENETEIYWKATSREEAAARVMTFA